MLEAKRGFSLVELSIVLVILGLLVGGILTGKSLIHAAEVRSVGNDMQAIRTAMYSFRDKYFYMPGDINNAASFWGCTNCNGNGDGVIANHGADAAIAAGRYEDSLVMYHLSQAGLIAGTYTGDYDAGRRIYSSDNAYMSKISKAAFAVARPDIWGATTSIKVPWAICLGPNSRGFTCSGPQNFTYAFFAEDAWNLDTKIDDGSARNGKLLADSCMIDSNHWGFDDAVIYRSTNANYDYDLDDTSISCGLMYLP